MSAQTIPLPLLGTMAGFRRFSVAEYHRLTEIGVLTENDRLELIEGYLVLKMPHNPPHDGSIQLVDGVLAPHLPSGWCIRIQSAITLPESEPEPDLVIARGTRRSYLSRHPAPGDIGLVVEVADSTLLGDRADKGRIYARANLPCYWIVNVQDGQVEVYTSPSGPAAVPGYVQRQDFRPGDAAPFVLDGVTIASLPVRELLP